KDCPGSSPACDVVSHQCLDCMTDSDCPSVTPHCIGASCCAPESCAFVKTWLNTKHDLCGNNYAFCGDAYCGTCSVGDCVEGQCTLAGKACAPSTSGQCAAGEICAYNADWKDYRCTYDYTGAHCTYPDNNGDQCADVEATGTA